MACGKSYFRASMPLVYHCITDGCHGDIVDALMPRHCRYAATGYAMLPYDYAFMPLFAASYVRRHEF